jgi:predicted ester cyclase
MFHMAGTSTDQNKAIVRRFVDEVWNQGNLNVIDELVAPGFRGHGHMGAPHGGQSGGQPGGQHFAPGPEGTRQFVHLVRSAFLDLCVTVEQQLAEGDLVATRWTLRGTQQGAFMGMAPSGKQVSVSGTVIDRIANGTVAEEWIDWDRLGLMQQLGAMQR